MKVTKVSKQPLRKFNSPINIGGIRMTSQNDSKSVDEQTTEYLSNRRTRRLEEAKDAELGRAVEEEKTEAARLRKEREQIESGKTNPGKEETVENVNKQVEEAAAVAAEAAGAGVDPLKAAALATGKSRVVIVEKADEGAKTAEGALRERAEVIEQAKALYCSCIDAGGDPKRCADMVAGLIPTQPGASSPQATSITELVGALKTLDDLRGPNAGMEALKLSFDSLAAEIRQGRGNVNQPLDPVAFAKQQAEALKEWKKVIDEINPSPAGTGEPLEVVKEKNRHDEQMETIRDEREYKESITEIASSIPERIGKGMARRHEKGSSSDSGDGLPYISCTEKGCGTKIYYTPESQKITCPKCQTVYDREEKSEEKSEVEQ